jgi:hypothetical protein
VVGREYSTGGVAQLGEAVKRERRPCSECGDPFYAWPQMAFEGCILAECPPLAVSEPLECRPGNGVKVVRGHRRSRLAREALRRTA